MITYTYEKPIAEIQPEDENFTLIFTDSIKIHYDSVVIPRLETGNVDVIELEIRINNLVDYVLNKYPNNFE